MKEILEHLQNLQNSLPAYNSTSSYSELNKVLTDYKNCLDYLNSYNDEYKRATSVYYNDISEIRDSLGQSLYGNSTEKKNAIFNEAKTSLRSNIKALATLIKNQEEFAAVV